MDTNIQTGPCKIGVSFSGQQIYLGIDVRQMNWNVSVYLGESFFQTFHQEANSSLLLNYLQSHFPGDIMCRAIKLASVIFRFSVNLSHLE